MKRIIVDYNKLTNEILTLLLERFPDGYDDSHIVRFRNAQNELVEAVEVRTEDTIYLVKVSTKLASRLEKFDDDNELDDIAEPIDSMKLDIDDEDAPSADEEEEDDDDADEPKRSRGEDGEDDDDDDDDDFDDDKDFSDDDDEDEEDEK
ncbi:DNA primase [Flavobacterium selenitireducens]|uniref:DNA primase n=1 Tax=Flavobacterium selenitireducens TaxID=2722704 RepID=UPI00168ADDF6|nr:DNA primase [Flavobacterium selenitireducens]MBD3583032.1 DNA primase [Flavobacterium selenitireducens]